MRKKCFAVKHARTRARERVKPSAGCITFTRRACVLLINTSALCVSALTIATAQVKHLHPRLDANPLHERFPGFPHALCDGREVSLFPQRLVWVGHGDLASTCVCLLVVQPQQRVTPVFTLRHLHQCILLCTDGAWSGCKQTHIGAQAKSVRKQSNCSHFAFRCADVHSAPTRRCTLASARTITGVFTESEKKSHLRGF
jgi:hypothetical protein